MLLAGMGAVGALALARTARAATCGDPGPLAPTGPTMRNVYDKIAFTDDGLAEARTPITSLPPSATALHVISAPGVYYMTGNLTGVAGMSCIEVAADNVEIECDGFVFVGVPGTRQCIVAPAPQRCIGIYDAGFVGWEGTCIDLSSSSDCYVEETWFDSCDASGSPLGTGACTLGSGGTIDDCNVLSCISGHLRVGPNGVIEECISLDSTGGCFVSVGPAVMEDNFALNNTGAAIVVDTGGVVIGNRVVSTASGISVGSNSVVAENDITGCTGVALSVDGHYCNIEENHVSSSATGIVVGASSLSVMVDGNHVAGVSGTSLTIAASTQCLVVRNSVSSVPGGTGYDIAAGSSYGPIVNAVAVGDLSSLGTAIDPTSNFLY